MPQPQPQPHPASRGAKPYGQIWTRDGLACNVSRAADGRLYTDHFRLSGPFRNRWHLIGEFRRCCGSLDPQLVVKRDGPRDRLRGATSPVGTEDLQPPPPPSEKLVASVAESASALSLQETHVSSSGVEPDVSSSGVWIDTTDESSSDSDDSDDDSPSSKILFLRRPKWHRVYFLRTDRSGQFRMYPDLGGPFQSLDQADSAITQHLAKLERHQFNEKDKYSIVDKLIHEHNYYPDGTPKRGPNSRSKTHPDEGHRHLIQALLDQYNDDNNLSGNLAHDLESLLRHEWIHEKNRWYFHFNFTTKTGNLFFAEVSQRQGERAWKVNCCCIIDSNENGQCKGCRNNGSPDMKHPNNTDAYVAGRLDGYLPFGDGERNFDDLEAEAARLRVLFRGLDDPDTMERVRLRAMQAFKQQ